MIDHGCCGAPERTFDAATCSWFPLVPAARWMPTVSISSAMILYTCPAQTHGANAPLVKHPCGVAAKALDAAGQSYEVKVVGGFKNVPFSRRGKRQEIVDLTGQEDVPVLVTEDGSIIAGSKAIVAWARGLGAT